jgi:hypothetical protein
MNPEGVPSPAGRFGVHDGGKLGTARSHPGDAQDRRARHNPGSTLVRRFRSTLQALLTVRQRQERLAMERYSEALQARQRATTALATADRSASKPAKS